MDIFIDSGIRCYKGDSLRAKILEVRLAMMAEENVRAAELARRKRILVMKQVIIFAVLFMTVIPAVSAVLLLDKVGKLEKRYQYLVEQDIHTLMDSAGAFAENPNATVAEDPVIPDGQKQEGQTPDDGTPVETGGDGDAVTPEEKKVYLTFDDGPSIYTGQILDILAANDVKATFFVIGRSEKYFEYYKRIVEEGHTLAMHSYSHEYKKIYASVDAFYEDLRQLQDLLYQVTGVECKLYRFPGGSSNTIADSIQPFIECLNEHDITYYDWNALNGDAVSEELSPQKLIDNIMKNVRQNKNSVVLMHDLQSRYTTVESLQDLIDVLKEEGYTLLPIDENTPLVQHVKAEDAEE